MASPTLDGSVQGNVGSGTTCSVSLTTSNPNDFICVAVLCNGGPVVSVTATGLTFTRRAQNVGTATNVELWYAQSASALSAKSITVTQTSSGFMTVTAFGVSGATGWDNNANLPSVIGDGSGNATTARASLTTSKADDFLIGIYRMHTTSTPTAGSGWTAIAGANFQLVEYKSVSATQSATDATLTTGNNDQNGGIGDALTSDALPPTPTLSLDGSATGTFSTTTAGTVTLTTSQADDVIVVVVATEKNGALTPVTSVSDTGGLTWTQRAEWDESTADGGAFGSQQTLQTWWAHSPTALSSRVITVTCGGGATDDATIVAFGVHGADTSNPFDTNASLPKSTTVNTVGSATLTGIATNDSAFLFAMACNRNSQTEGLGSSVGWTLLASVHNGLGSSNRRPRYSVQDRHGRAEWPFGYQQVARQ
jgi:hypothetical protein